MEPTIQICSVAIVASLQVEIRLDSRPWSSRLNGSQTVRLGRGIGEMDLCYPRQRTSEPANQRLLSFHLRMQEASMMAFNALVDPADRNFAQPRYEMSFCSMSYKASPLLCNLYGQPRSSPPSFAPHQRRAQFSAPKQTKLNRRLPCLQSVFLCELGQCCCQL